MSLPREFGLRTCSDSVHTQLHAAGAAVHVVVEGEVQTAGRRCGRTSDFGLGSSYGRAGFHQHVAAHCKQRKQHQLSKRVSPFFLINCFIICAVFLNIRLEFSAMLKAVCYQKKHLYDIIYHDMIK